MTNLKVSYVTCTNVKSQIFETASITFEVMDYVADSLLTSGASGLAKQKLEKAIIELESLKGYTYFEGSIYQFESDTRIYRERGNN